MNLIDPKLAAILACPIDKAPVVEDVEESRLVCSSCGRRYPVENGIPIMLPERAEGGPDE